MAYRRRYHYYDNDAESQDELVNPRPVRNKSFFLCHFLKHLQKHLFKYRKNLFNKFFYI